MRIRSTKPEFWRSERIASVGWDARLVLKGLESYVDDNGAGKDDIALIVGEVFPRDMLANPRETVARVSEAISTLADAGLLWRYEDAGNQLLFVSFWESIQRIDKPGKGRFRRPDGTTQYGESEIRESVASPRETVAPGTGEQGNRGTGEQGQEKPSSSEADDAPTAEVVELCDYLADRIEANGSKRPPVTAGWLRACRLMMERDGRTPEQIRRAIDWCQADGFWRSNILSMPKLRERFDTLRLQAQRGSARPPGTDDRVRGHLELAERLAQREQPLEVLG